MWDWLMHFFANLILFTAGCAVVVLWIVAIIALCIEGHDLWVERDKEEE